MHSTEDHRRDREAGRLVYPVLSRRSGGLSLGVNLFPRFKRCGFDCPYCEVFLPSDPRLDPGLGFSSLALREELAAFLDSGYAESWAPEPVRDICLSGNGEPTASPFLGEALEVCAGLRRERPDILRSASLVIITNSTCFLDPLVRGLLERYCRDEGLVVWAKLDAGSEGLFKRMSGSAIGLARIAQGILDFARRSAVVIQTMLCEVDGLAPTDAEIAEYAGLLARLVSGGARIEEAHLYTLSRPSPEKRCAAIPDADLERAAAAVRAASGLRVRCFGPSVELQRG